MLREGVGTSPLLPVHVFAGQYDVCEAFASEHLETTQRARATTNTSTPIKDAQKDLWALQWFKALHSTLHILA